MERVGVIGNPHYAGLEPVLERIQGAASELGLSLCYESALRGDGHAVPATEEDWIRSDPDLDEVDWILTLGGDGTLLRGARMAGPRGIPVLGCNLGRLGFLTGVSPDAIERALEVVSRGECEEERRLTLDVSVAPAQPDGEGDAGAHYTVNDAVIHKSGVARLITLRVQADEDEVGQYSADGIILATPTGSTAYSLSAGGPIVEPTLGGIVATPISPHTLAVRPVVFPADVKLAIELVSDHDDLALTIDGQTKRDLRAGDRVEVTRSAHDLRLLKLPGHSFFSVLRRKLRWGDVRPSGD